MQRIDNLIKVNSKCFIYKNTKQDHKFEDYLVNLPRCFYVPILKLRSCNHRLYQQKENGTQTSLENDGIVSCVMKTQLMMSITLLLSANIGAI